jgi:hypothetical protein
MIGSVIGFIEDRIGYRLIDERIGDHTITRSDSDISDPRTDRSPIR